MHWKLKAYIQTMIARLPTRASHGCYYAMQRATGSFRHAQIDTFVQAALGLRDCIERHGGRIDGATFLEVGTGRRLTLPILLWGMGARRVITVDLHSYVRKSIVELELRALVAAADRVGTMTGFRADRLSALEDLLTRKWDLEALATLCSIDYRAPADASQLDLPVNSVDYHISYTVLEHIPPSAIIAVLREAGRVLRPSGLAVHLVDHSDHFAHSDPSISAINFLQYEDEAWARLADNPYMYMNRLRVDDYSPLYEAGRQDIREMRSTEDHALLSHLSLPSFTLASRFKGKTKESLATTTTWIVSRPCPPVSGT